MNEEIDGKLIAESLAWYKSVPYRSNFRIQKVRLNKVSVCKNLIDEKLLI